MAPFTERVFAASPALRLVAVSRGGPVNVDLAAATRHGVRVSFAPGRNAPAAAEFAVGLMLAAMRRITAADAEPQAGSLAGRSVRVRGERRRASAVPRSGSWATGPSAASWLG